MQLTNNREFLVRGSTFTDDRCYLFVFGPGFGESIILRFPGGIWMVVDGCEVARQSPAAKILEQEGAQWTAVVLTHPHLDHSRGLDTVLGSPGEGLVGCADTRLADPESWSESPDPEQHLREGRTEAVMAAIQDHWERDRGSRWLLRRGDTKEVGPARIKVLHPDNEAVEAGRRSGRMNRLSSAMLIEWEEMRLVLGADVETVDWESVGAWLGDLGAHACLKVPHHGADSGLGRCWMTGESERLWIVTPFNKGGRLPDFGDGRGLASLLEVVSPIRMTGLPVAADMQGEIPYRASRAALNSGAALETVATAIPGAAESFRIPEHDDWASCYVLAELRANGEAEVVRNGAGAVVVDRI